MDPNATLSESGSPLDDGAVPVPEARPVRRDVAAGRYVLLEELGTGAGGTVVGAWDPQLDRKIALRLVASRDADERERLLRGARALARLSHPNVVTIHDAGEQDERVWIAMELVTGATLDAWARARTRRLDERVRVVTDVARGLAAAHAAGLVHRGLEPARVMVDDDGRVRVTGFALAPGRAPVDDQLGWSELARALLLGAPPFADGADDSRELRDLRNAIDPGATRASHARAGMPRWLRHVVDRAGAAERSERWPSMTALVDALERGRTRARVRAGLLVLASVAVLGIAVEGQRRWELARRTAACEATGATIDAVWNDDARQRLRDAFAATGVSFAASTAEKVMPWLDEHATAWAQARTEACLASEVRGTWSEDTHDRAAWCLEELQMSMASLVDELGRADATSVQKAVSAVASPVMTSACTDEELLRRQPAPPGEGREAIREVRETLSRARSLSLAGRYDAALVLATEARTRAEGLDWPPLWASARALEADLLERMGSFDDARTASAEAFGAAGLHGVWKVAADAAMLSSWIEGRLVRAAEGRAWAEHAALAIARAGDPEGLQESARLQTLANAYRAARELERARALHERALAILEHVLGPDHPNVASCLNNLATVHADAGELATARALYERALAIREQALGPDHPDVAGSLTNLGNMTSALGDTAAAQRLFERAIAIRERALGPEHPDVAGSLTGLGNVHGIAGRFQLARAVHERVLALRERTLGPKHPEVANTLMNVGHAYEALGRYDEAARAFERASGIMEPMLGPAHPLTLAILGERARMHAAMGEDAESRALQDRARAIRSSPRSASP